MPHAGVETTVASGRLGLRVALGRDATTDSYRRLSKTFHGSAKEADAALRVLIDEQSSGVDGVEATFGQLLDQWLDECDRLDLSPTTMRTYRAQIERTIRPRLGKVAVRSVSVKHLDDLYGAVKASGKSPKTIRNHHAIVSAALHQGVRWGWVRANVAEMAKPPRVEHRRVLAPSADIVREVIASAEEQDPALPAF